MEYRLVELYEENKCLWDPLYVGQLKGTSRDGILKSIASQLGENVTSEDVRYKIKYNRDYFNRERKKITTSKLTAINPQDIYQPQWYLFPKLQFLEAHSTDFENDLSNNDNFIEQVVDMRNDDDTSNNAESPPIVILNEDNSDSGFTPSSSFDIQNQHHNYSAALPSTTSLLETKLREKTPSNKRHKSSSVDSPVIVSASHQASHNSNTGHTKGPSSTFGNFVGERLNEFDEEQRSWAMFKISEVLFKASRRDFEV
ncbi:hypothetical protein CHUAL_001806 [Chamberlinius hualienensis]